MINTRKNVLTIERWQRTYFRSTSSHQPPTHTPKRKQIQVPPLEAIRPQILAITTKAFVISCHNEDNTETLHLLKSNLKFGGYRNHHYISTRGILRITGAVRFTRCTHFLERSYSARIRSRPPFVSLNNCCRKTAWVELRVCSSDLNKFESTSEINIYRYIE